MLLRYAVFLLWVVRREYDGFKEGEGGGDVGRDFTNKMEA